MATKRDAQPVAALKEERAAEKGSVDLSLIIAAAAVDLRPAPLPDNLRGEAASQGVADDGSAECAFEIGVIVATIIGLDIAAGLECGLAGDEVDRASRGVASVERALWAFQYLDALLIEHLEREQRRGRSVDAIDIHTRRLRRAFVEIVGAHAAQRDFGIAILAERQMHGQRRRIESKVAYRGRTGFAQPVTVE